LQDLTVPTYYYYILYQSGYPLTNTFPNKSCNLSWLFIIKVRILNKIKEIISRNKNYSFKSSSQEKVDDEAYPTDEGDQHFTNQNGDSDSNYRYCNLFIF